VSHPAEHSSHAAHVESPAVRPGPDRIVLVRHGATEWSTNGRHTGRTDLALTAAGRDQARAAAPLLQTVLDRPDPVVFSSPLQRARETASLMLPGCDPVVADSLAEFDYGSYEGLTTPQIFDRDPTWNLFRGGCPGGETALQVTARVDGFIAKVERMATGRLVVVFTHGHLSRILAVRLLELPTESAAAFYNETASVGVIDARRDRFVLVGWNRQAT
jgi:probable phosphoglycerate mutase